MGGSEGNISQCSLQSNKTGKKSAELIIEKVADTEPEIMTEEEKQLRREQCLSRHDSIRTQANIQLLDEKINLIGSLKAHREHCQHLETTLQNLEDQATALPQVPQEMISTILELKKDVLYTFSYPASTASDHEMPIIMSHPSESDLSCCDQVASLEDQGVGKFDSISNLSSSHSMSRYGSESPKRTLLLTDYSTASRRSTSPSSLQQVIIKVTSLMVLRDR